MDAKHLTLTQVKVRSLPLPKKHWAVRKNGERELLETRTVYYDTRTPGLGIRLSSGGTRAFILYRKINGRPQTVTLGRFPALSVEQARAVAHEMAGDIARGQNPQDVKKAARGEMTLGMLFDEYLRRHALGRKRTWKSDETRFRLYLKPWANRPLSKIKRTDVHSLHSSVGKEKGPYAANRLLSLLSRMFNLARTWEFTGDNPAAGVERFREHSRERFLEPDELPRFFRAVMDDPNETARDYVLLSLLTGQRKGNVLAMAWDAVDLTRAEWVIPAGESKTNTELKVPLTPEAMNILIRRKAEATGPWVLPGAGKTGHLAEPKSAWKRIIKRAGIDNLRLHDLRRSLGSWQAGLGISLPLIGRSLGHKSYQSTMIYSRLSLDPVRAAMEAATNAMLTAGGLKEPAPVVKMRKRNK